MDAKKLDKIISELSELLGEFSEHAVIGGGVALLIYRNYLTGSRNPQFLEAAATDDIDLLVPRAYLRQGNHLEIGYLNLVFTLYPFSLRLSGSAIDLKSPNDSVILPIH